MARGSLLGFLAAILAQAFFIFMTSVLLRKAQEYQISIVIEFSLSGCDVLKNRADGSKVSPSIL